MEPDSGPLAEIVAAARDAAPDPQRDCVAEFARLALRRIPAGRLRAADTRRVGRRLVEAFRLLDTRPVEAIAVRVTTPDVALDGHSDPGTVVQVSARDRPLLLSTVTTEIEHRGLTAVRTLHPIVGVERDEEGRVVRVRPAREAAQRESYLHLVLDRELDGAAREDLRATLEEHLADLRAATDDHRRMRHRVRELADRLRAAPPPGVDEEAATETAALLDWLVEDHLVLLGWREYRVEATDARHQVRVVPGSGRGILRDESSSRFAEPVPIDELPPELARRLRDPRLLTVSRTNRRSTVHRRDRMDYIGITRYRQDGTVAGEARLLGLFTGRAARAPVGETPVLRRRLAEILEREDVVPGSHDHATIEALVQALPKDELFQTDTEELHQTIMTLLDAEERGATRTRLRVERFTRTVSVLVTLPRDRYGSGVRRRVETLLRERFQATDVDADVSLGAGSNAIGRFRVHVDRELPEVSAEALEADVRRVTRGWDDRVADELEERVGGPSARRLLHQVVPRLSDAYRESVPPGHAVLDLRLLETVVEGAAELTVTLQGPRESGGPPRLKLIGPGALPLSEVVPVLEGLGLRVLDEQPFELTGPGPPAMVHDLGVRPPPETTLSVDADGPRLAEAVAAVWDGRAESDSLNQLVLSAGLTWEEVAVLRAYRRLRRQLGTAHTPEHVNTAVTGQPRVAAGIVRLFGLRFDPDRAADDETIAACHREVSALCDGIERLEHDRILRGLLELVGATVRTNFYRPDTTVERLSRRRTIGQPRVVVPYVALKLDAGTVAEVPEPVPYREIFVYSPDVEGVHLRADRLARGGLRASDRRDDVRTEVLDLMKAQVLKNALIVPTGAKGGFVVKHPPGDPDAARAELERQYVTFVRGLLDVTDNLEAGTVVPPPGVRRHDGDDPYLVVAADKGTATLSDTANRVATDRGFWLGDAFASGGSRGYDHKELGITARGAWLAVRQHFAELGIDPDHEPITVVGIGDMSGDVFGNGMLLSDTVRLVAAFDHRDVFLDPDPDPAVSHRERRRLFEQPGSSWQDYDRSRLSPGGGVFSRRAKRIELTDEVRELLRVDEEALEPAALVRAVLRAPADLLFAGGVGTFVKSSAETDAQVDDRANDPVRVGADELRVRVVAEGANLAVTQAGRIQYARRGGRINQDAVDNAAGVALSDREVNGKILLAPAVREGRLEAEERDRLLRAVTEDVVARVLEEVDRQIRALAAEAARSPHQLDGYIRLLDDLEAEGVLDRGTTALPSRGELAERAAAGAGLTRPELATLLAGTKRQLADLLAASDLPRRPALRPVLRGYFPDALVERVGDRLDDHPLRAELVATVLANRVVDRMGITFVSRLSAETRTDPERVVAAFWTASRVTDAPARWDRIQALETTVPPDRLRSLDRTAEEIVARLTRLYATDPAVADPAALVERDRPVFALLRQVVVELGTQRQRRARVGRIRTLMDDLVDRDLAVELAGSDVLALTADVGLIRQRLGHDSEVATVADALLRIGQHAGVGILRRLLGAGTEAGPPRGPWTERERRGLVEDLWRARRRAVVSALTHHRGGGAHEIVRRWLEEHAEAVQRTGELVREVAADPERPLAALSVAARAIRDLLEQD